MKFFVATTSLALLLASGHASPVHSGKMTRQSHVLLPRFTNPAEFPECKALCARGNTTLTPCPDNVTEQENLKCSCPQTNTLNQIFKECFECGFRIEPNDTLHAEIQKVADDLVQECNKAGFSDVHSVTIELHPANATAPNATAPNGTAPNASARSAPLVFSFALGSAACLLLSALTGL